MIDGDENANNHETSFSPTDPIPQCKKEEEGGANRGGYIILLKLSV